jgi:hypothetical protein
MLSSEVVHGIVCVRLVVGKIDKTVKEDLIEVGVFGDGLKSSDEEEALFLRDDDCVGVGHKDLLSTIIF